MKTLRNFVVLKLHLGQSAAESLVATMQCLVARVNRTWGVVVKAWFIKHIPVNMNKFTRYIVQRSLLAVWPGVFGAKKVVFVVTTRHILLNFCELYKTFWLSDSLYLYRHKMVEVPKMKRAECLPNTWLAKNMNSNSNTSMLPFGPRDSISV